MQPFRFTEPVVISSPIEVDGGRSWETPAEEQAQMVVAPSTPMLDTTPSREKASQIIELYDEARRDLRPPTRVIVRGDTLRVIGSTVTTHPWTGWQPPSQIRCERVDPLLPDRGTLYRVELVFDRDQNKEIRTLVPVWTGATSAETSYQAALSETGAQLVTVMRVQCSMPLDADVQPEIGMVLIVSEARDPRLIGRELTISDVGLTDHDVARRFTAIDESEA